MSVQQNWEDRKQNRKQSFMTMYNYVMGVLWLGIGLLFLLNKPLDIEWIKSDPVIDNVFGVVGVVYGLFRLYRGYKQKDFQR